MIIRRLINKINRRERIRLFKRKVKDCGRLKNVGKDITIQHPDCVHIGNDVSIGDGTCFLPVKHYAGKNYLPSINFGDGCYIGKRNSFGCIININIGKNVLFAGEVHITDHSHGFEDVNKPIIPQPLITKGGVTIEDDCWLGFASEILSGVHIGKHCVIAARSVVVKDVPDYSIVAGNPAKVVKRYNFETEKWERV